MRDEAMMRQYSGWYARFTQADPSDGSYDLTDPQSLNRYAYTNNDPVNFTDPSGLNAVSPGTTFGGAGVLWSIWFGNHTDGFELVHQFFQPYPGGGGGDGVSGGPQEPGQEPAQEEPRDCYAFANEVARIADGIFVDNHNPATNSFPHNVNAFMDALARRFTELSSATEGALRRVQKEGTVLITEFGSGGFAGTFVDPDPQSANQARHAVFGLAIGYAWNFGSLRYGGASALSVANDRETGGNPDSNRVDIALNNLTVPMGGRLAGGNGQQLARGLADWIRSNLCAPRN